MPSIKYDIKLKQDEGLLFSPSFLIQNCLYGVKLCNSDGRALDNSVITTYIKAAQTEIERWLGISLTKRVIIEKEDFFINDWKNWGFIRTSFPVVKPLAINGYVNTVRQVVYPEQWLSSQKTSDGRFYKREMFIVPVSNASAQFNSVVFTGITPNIGFQFMNNVPNYWEIAYGTGFNKIPADIIKAILYLAAIPLYMWLENAILPQSGLSNYSISIDGLSQSKSVGNIYKGKIESMLLALGDGSQKPGLLLDLKNYYNSFTLTVC